MSSEMEQHKSCIKLDEEFQLESFAVWQTFSTISNFQLKVYFINGIYLDK